jgi:hypothetical protein
MSKLNSENQEYQIEPLNDMVIENRIVNMCWIVLGGGVLVMAWPWDGQGEAVGIFQSAIVSAFGLPQFVPFDGN